MENYPILSNEECIWLDLPDDYEFDVDVCLSSIYLQRMVSENPAIEELIKEFDCDIIIEWLHKRKDNEEQKNDS